MPALQNLQWPLPTQPSAADPSWFAALIEAVRFRMASWVRKMVSLCQGAQLRSRAVRATELGELGRAAERPNLQTRKKAEHSRADRRAILKPRTPAKRSA